jgi:hypothetical protein
LAFGHVEDPGPATHIVAAFRRGLGAAGYDDGKNVVIE